MTSTDALVEHLRKWKQEAAAQAGDAAKDAETKAAWLRALSGLMETLHAWLRPLEQLGLLQVLRESTSVTEERFGTYDAPTMTVTAAGPRAVCIHPVGLSVLGSNGRVDLDAGQRKCRLLRQADDGWLIALPAASSRALWDVRPLDAETFAQALDELLQ